MVYVLQSVYHKCVAMNLRWQTSSVRLLGYLLARMAGVYDLKLNPDATQAADVAVNKAQD